MYPGGGLRRTDDRRQGLHYLSGLVLLGVKACGSALGECNGGSELVGHRLVDILGLALMATGYPCGRSPSVTDFGRTQWLLESA